MWVFVFGIFSVSIHHQSILITESGTPDCAGPCHRHNGGFHPELRAATSPFRKEEAEVHRLSSVLLSGLRRWYFVYEVQRGRHSPFIKSISSISIFSIPIYTCQYIGMIFMCTCIGDVCANSSGPIAVCALCKC